MIMPRANDQLLLPVNPLFVALTLLVAFALNIVPLGRVPISWHSCWCSGTFTSRAASASAWRSSLAC
jgi:hypothetical protein